MNTFNEGNQHGSAYEEPPTRTHQDTVGSWLEEADVLIRANPLPAILSAVAIGVATHFVLDVVGLSMGLGTLLWPLLGWQFPVFPFRNLGQHLTTILNPITLAGELLGAAILLWDYWRARRLRAASAAAAAGDR